MLGELADFFGPQAQAAGVRIRTQLAAEPAVVPADGPLLKQALLNLLINATQAMADARADRQPHGGANELLLRTETVRVLKQPELRIHVTDTGPGIPLRPGSTKFSNPISPPAEAAPAWACPPPAASSTNTAERSASTRRSGKGRIL